MSTLLKERPVRDQNSEQKVKRKDGETPKRINDGIKERHSGQTNESLAKSKPRDKKIARPKPRNNR